ncbi:glycosyltransferase family 4 protein [Natronosalvus halobius]|uniref:glycosyltransferase family 4 protein n=1 Tax=Natronosalvus halobius TaxID=2953746 RepID=UPI0020A03790|nr:glycosyltransferase family 4 protein [Natronosalvus halobius]USZ71473.1 glycosyltransferase family 4 protein [Natronosalvus halobius]
MDGLHLTTAHTPLDTRIFDKEAKSLAEYGFDIGIMAHNTPNGEDYQVSFYDLGIPSTRIDRWKNVLQAARKAKDLDASIYHFHDPELIPVGLYLSKMTDSAIIYDVHEDYGHIASMREWIPNMVAPFLSRGVPQIERYASSRFDAVVTVSEWIAEPFVDINDNVCIAHNFPKVGSQPVHDKSIERTSEYVLCYVGGLVDVRGIHRMLRVLKILVDRDIDIELWAIGSWKPDANKAQAKHFIQENGLTSRVKFPGYLDHDEMFQYLYSADVGLALLDVQHYQKGVPTKLFEYLYAGLPIIVTPIDAIGKYMPEKYCHTVSQSDMVATAETIETALETNYDKQEMRSLVEEKYSWESEAESLISLYNRLV